MSDEEFELAAREHVEEAHIGWTLCPCWNEAAEFTKRDLLDSPEIKGLVSAAENLVGEYSKEKAEVEQHRRRIINLSSESMLGVYDALSAFQKRFGGDR